MLPIVPQSNDAEDVIAHILSDPALSARVEAYQNEDTPALATTEVTETPSLGHGNQSETSALSSAQSSPSLMVEQLNLEAVLQGIAIPGGGSGGGNISVSPISMQATPTTTLSLPAGEGGEEGESGDRDSPPVSALSDYNDSVSATGQLESELMEEASLSIQDQDGDDTLGGDPGNTMANTGMQDITSIVCTPYSQHHSNVTIIVMMIMMSILTQSPLPTLSIHILHNLNHYPTSHIIGRSNRSANSSITSVASSGTNFSQLTRQDFSDAIGEALGGLGGLPPAPLGGNEQGQGTPLYQNSSQTASIGDVSLLSSTSGTGETDQVGIFASRGEIDTSLILPPAAPTVGDSSSGHPLRRYGDLLRLSEESSTSGAPRPGGPLRTSREERRRLAEQPPFVFAKKGAKDGNDYEPETGVGKVMYEVKKKRSRLNQLLVELGKTLLSMPSRIL